MNKLIRNFLPEAKNISIYYSDLEAWFRKNKKNIDQILEYDYDKDSQQFFFDSNLEQNSLKILLQFQVFYLYFLKNNIETLTIRKEFSFIRPQLQKVFLDYKIFGLKIVDINIVENEQHEIGFKKELLDFERQWVKSYPIARRSAYTIGMPIFCNEHYSSLEDGLYEQFIKNVMIKHPASYSWAQSNIPYKLRIFLYNCRKTIFSACARI